MHGFTGAPATLECMGVLPVHGFPAQVLSVRLAARHGVVPSDKPVLGLHWNYQVDLFSSCFEHINDQTN